MNRCVIMQRCICYWSRGEAGSGLQFDTVCSEDVLDRNWQRLILTHLEEKIHRGVLTGAEITDMKVTLLTGRAHMKHTEGGDFRQATYRALRQGADGGKKSAVGAILWIYAGTSVGKSGTCHGGYGPDVWNL